MSLKRDLEDFMLYCQLTKQYSDNTVRNYRNTLERFSQFVEDKKIYRTPQIDLDLINDYRKFLSKKESSRHGEISQKAQAYQIVVIRSFLKFMLKSGALVLNPDKLELPRSKMRRIEYLTDEEIKKLIGAIVNDTSQKIPMVQKLRNQALILAMFSSGLRISEVLGLKKLDIAWQNSTAEASDIADDIIAENETENLDQTNFKDSDLKNASQNQNLENSKLDLDQNNPGLITNQIQIEGKGGKIRSIFLAPSAVEAIHQYLIERGSDFNPYLFISHSKNAPKNQTKTSKKMTHLTPRMVQMMLQKYAHRIGVYKTITPHTLRHSFATKILFEGGDLRSVQTLLGHTNIATTQIYTHITDWQIKELHSKVFGKIETITAQNSTQNSNPYSTQIGTQNNSNPTKKTKKTIYSNINNPNKPLNSATSTQPKISPNLESNLDSNLEQIEQETEDEVGIKVFDDYAKTVSLGRLESFFESNNQDNIDIQKDLGQTLQDQKPLERPLENLAKIIRKINKKN